MVGCNYGDCIMKTLLLLTVLLLTGCASICKSHCLLGFGPGNATFESINQWKNEQNKCQTNTPNNHSFTRNLGFALVC